MTLRQPPPKTARWILLGLLLVVAVAVSIVVSHKRLVAQQDADQKAWNWLPDQSSMSFQPWWQNNPELSAFASIARTLANNHVRRCASLSWSESLDYEHVYLVACRGVTDTASYSIVRTDTQRVYTVGLHWLKERPLCAPTQIGRCSRQDAAP